jgi:hypothetical protein
VVGEEAVMVEDVRVTTGDGGKVATGRAREQEQRLRNTVIRIPHFKPDFIWYSPTNTWTIKNTRSFIKIPIHCRSQSTDRISILCDLP